MNGVHVKDYSWDNRTLTIHIQNWFSELVMPYEKPFDILIKVEGLTDEGPYNLVINGSDPVTLTAEELLKYKFTVNPLTTNEG